MGILRGVVCRWRCEPRRCTVHRRRLEGTSPFNVVQRIAGVGTTRNRNRFRLLVPLWCRILRCTRGNHDCRYPSTWRVPSATTPATCRAASSTSGTCHRRASKAASYSYPGPQQWLGIFMRLLPSRLVTGPFQSIWMRARRTPRRNRIPPNSLL